jgi:acyl-CoA reductase-like NAD-dependent aldehyde dehydrogenase
MTTQVQNLIAGEWTGTPETERRNPARPDEVVAVSPASTAATAYDAISAAEGAQPAWAATPPAARGAILMDAAEILLRRHTEIATDLVREEGKTLAEAKGEVRRAIDVLRYFGSAGWRLSGETYPSAFPDTMVYTRHEPLGVVGLITPWNFPIAIPAWKLAPALISGNTVVLKPADLTTLTASNLVKALVDAGLPAGVLNLVTGRGSVVGSAIVDDPRVQAVSFTGSTEVGLGIHDAMSRRRARAQLEMGGKNALVVLDDADIEKTAALAAVAGFSLTGQACTATSRVFCTPKALGPFLDAMRAQAERYRPGDGLDEGTLMGPVVSESQLETDVSAVARAEKDGATVVAGGGDPEGLFFAPTVVADVAPDASIIRNEVFGPVLAVAEVADLDEAIGRVNDSRYGLTAGIATTNLAAAQRFAAEANVGVVKVNRPTTGLDLNTPFGGVKDSSSNTWREQGPTATEFYTWTKTVYLGHDR